MKLSRAALGRACLSSRARPGGTCGCSVVVVVVALPVFGVGFGLSICWRFGLTSGEEPRQSETAGVFGAVLARSEPVPRAQLKTDGLGGIPLGAFNLAPAEEI
ncbi:MAG: hypothetical protein IPK13_24860 [Deltaproteobacteria bacterium]|nr:hypothetical protein [Deltaproteobacteria bacterium]